MDELDWLNAVRGVLEPVGDDEIDAKPIPHKWGQRLMEIIDSRDRDISGQQETIREQGERIKAFENGIRSVQESDVMGLGESWQRIHALYDLLPEVKP
jgi:hypothetical protein